MVAPIEFDEDGNLVEDDWSDPLPGLKEATDIPAWEDLTPEIIAGLSIRQILLIETPDGEPTAEDNRVGDLAAKKKRTAAPDDPAASAESVEDEDDPAAPAVSAGSADDAAAPAASVESDDES